MRTLMDRECERLPLVPVTVTLHWHFCCPLGHEAPAFEFSMVVPVPYPAKGRLVGVIVSWSAGCEGALVEVNTIVPVKPLMLPRTMCEVYPAK